jgi:hypothetical protein
MVGKIKSYNFSSEIMRNLRVIGAWLLEIPEEVATENEKYMISVGGAESKSVYGKDIPETEEKLKDYLFEIISEEKEQYEFALNNLNSVESQIKEKGLAGILERGKK